MKSIMSYAPPPASVNKNTNHKGGGRWSRPHQRTLVLIFSLYITFVFLSRVPYVAEQSMKISMKDSYEYNLTFDTDGWQDHYYVERYEVDAPGIINLVYTTSSNTLTVTVDNIEVLWISCRSVFEDEAEDVYGIDPYDSSNFYKFYFIERDHLNVNIDSPQKVVELKFLDAPRPQEVWVDGMRWYEGSEYNFTSLGGIALSEVPMGHTTVDLYFKASDESSPIAKATAEPMVVPLGWSVGFSATGSFDPDGQIISWTWDFGDGSFADGKEVTYEFSTLGTFGVLLTVEDDSGLIDHTFCNITVVPNDDRPRISPKISDQVEEEDGAPWYIDLSSHFLDPAKVCNNRSWELTDADPELCIISIEQILILGEYTKSRLWFTPTPNAWGDQVVTIWLRNDNDVVDSQTFWVNITSVNDPPSIINTPSLIVHYDADYVFDYAPYIYDRDNPLEELTLSAGDSLGNPLDVKGHNVTYNYPEDLLDTTVLVTLTISDGEDSGTEVVQVNITDDWVPQLRKKIPDVTMNEGEIKINVFDLDDYFSDPDDDSLFYSSGETYVEVIIHDNHETDVSSLSEWSGVDTITFRARDPIGALAEDTAMITVRPVNDPPVISGVPNLVVRHGVDYRFDLRPYIHDADNTTDELSLTTSDDVFIRFDPLSSTVMILNYPESLNNKTIPLTITISDGILSDEQIIEVKVANNYPPELDDPLPDITFKEDEFLEHAFNLNDYFLDKDRDVLFFSSDQKKVIVDIDPSGWVNLGTGEKDWYGMESITFRAIDPHDAFTEDTIDITVIPVNDPPEIKHIPAQRGKVGDVRVLNLREYVTDVDDPLASLHAHVVGPEGVVKAQDMSVMIIHMEVGEATFVCTITDGQLENFTNVDIITTGTGMSEGMVKLSSFIMFLITIALCISCISGALWYRRHKGDYEIDAVLLIDNNGGNLITSKIRQKDSSMDEDIIGSMFSAVTDFVQESFGGLNGKTVEETCSDEDRWNLHELDLGEHTIVLERGTYVFLAVVITGRLGTKLTRKMERFIEDLEKKSPKKFKDWDGNLEDVEDVKLLMGEYFPGVEQEDSKIVGDITPSPMKTSIDMSTNSYGSDRIIPIDSGGGYHVPLDSHEEKTNRSECLASSIDPETLQIGVDKVDESGKGEVAKAKSRKKVDARRKSGSGARTRDDSSMRARSKPKTKIDAQRRAELKAKEKVDVKRQERLKTKRMAGAKEKAASESKRKAGQMGKDRAENKGVGQMGNIFEKASKIKKMETAKGKKKKIDTKSKRTTAKKEGRYLSWPDDMMGLVTNTCSRCNANYVSEDSPYGSICPRCGSLDTMAKDRKKRISPDVSARKGMKKRYGKKKKIPPGSIKEPQENIGSCEKDISNCCASTNDDIDISKAVNDESEEKGDISVDTNLKNGPYLPNASDIEEWVTRACANCKKEFVYDDSPYASAHVHCRACR